MSIEYVNDFYLRIYNLLKENTFIKEKINKIGFCIAKENIYPYLIINIYEVEDISNFSLKTYKIKFDINIYFRDKNMFFFTKMAEYIKSLLDELIIDNLNYQLLTINSGIINFEQGQDLSSLKMRISFIAILQKIN